MGGEVSLSANGASLVSLCLLMSDGGTPGVLPAVATDAGAQSEPGIDVVALEVACRPL
jgi:hypothetical protein